MIENMETALDQLRNADDIATTTEQQHAAFLVAAQVHATLALADAVRSAGLDVAYGIPQATT